ncbi:threonine/serine exporter family protein [Lactovum miscens]|uniref:Uncharacterized membrane protein YjjB (DUF3815 family) n=1 Tax=Lactovum miscens TaxID=190387 RepID=A0A841C8T8_9LACT|nr:threonine/serine exporter family protein [Lactovum miscens]MBB5888717.1 uncharacterized membrane protein YjjB (DUF3815 family) [Lactovum miscens]
MGLILQVFGAYVVTVTSGIIFETPKHLVLQSGFIGALGYLVYLLSLHYTGSAVATLLSGMIIALLSHIAARLLKSPVTIFYIPSIFPLVPGVGIYKIAYYYILGNTNLAGKNFVESISIAGAIALSIFFVDSFLEVYNTVKIKFKKI